MKYIKIYAIGLIVLMSALAINMLAKIFSLMNWYEFIDKPAGASLIDYVWLLIGYPFCLGLVVYIIINIKKARK